MKWWPWFKHLNHTHCEADLGPPSKAFETPDGAMLYFKACRYCGRVFVSSFPGVPAMRSTIQRVF